jgi:hypothetical protein
MGTLTTALQDVTAALATAAGADVEVSDHPGRFTEDELGRIVTQPKAVRVAIEGVESMGVEGGGLREALVTFSALVICSDVAGADRHQSALEITEKLATMIPYNSWGQPRTYKAVAPNSVEVQNLYSGDINGRGIAFWAITWTQTIRQQGE